MKKIFTIILTALMISGCGGEAKEAVTEEQSTMTKVENQIKIQIDNKIFNATLENNPTVEAFLNKLPLNIELEELNGNEKYYRFDEKFPTNDSNPKTIHTGDLMLFSGNYFVMFYKDFSTGYSYTRLGKIDNIEGLTEAVGKGNIKIKITK